MPKNVIIQWQAPEVKVKKEFKYLGVIRANPLDYIERYGSTLKTYNQLPEYVRDIQNPQGIELAANYEPVHELTGDIEALRLIDLDKEGLSIYQSYLENSEILRKMPGIPPNFPGVENTEDNYLSVNYFNTQPQSNVNSQSMADSHVCSNLESEINPFYFDSNLAETLESSIEQIFHLVDFNNTGRINIQDAEKTLLRLNSRLQKSYGEEEIANFFSSIESIDQSIDLNEFKRAFLNLAIA